MLAFFVELVLNPVNVDSVDIFCKKLDLGKCGIFGEDKRTENPKISVSRNPVLKFYKMKLKREECAGEREKLANANLKIFPSTIG